MLYQSIRKAAPFHRPLKIAMLLKVLYICALTNLNFHLLMYTTTYQLFIRTISRQRPFSTTEDSKNICRQGMI